MECRAPPTPHTGGIGLQGPRIQQVMPKYRYLSKKSQTCFYHHLTSDFVAINHVAGIFTLQSKLTCSLLHSFRFR